MTSRSFIYLICLTLFTGGLMSPPPAKGDNLQTAPGIPPRLAADWIHAVIEAGRTTYSGTIVDRMTLTGSLSASENWQNENTLMLPAQFLSRSSRLSNERGIGMRYRLMSLWPINKENGPGSKVIETGFKKIVEHPDQPFSWVVQSGGRWYFQAIYPDLAVNDSCVNCHNGHPDSPRRDFKRGDVMGGILINLPLGLHRMASPPEKPLLAPEVVTDYIHSVIESDRTIYSRDIVDRLQEKNVMKSSEHWSVENSLPLPAQFLLSVSRLIHKQRKDLDFRLTSLWPIDPRNGPANEFERLGLESVAMHPIRPYIGQTRLGGKHFFQAIYPDLAVAPSCANCHNNHPRSPRRDFALGDVMGGIVVTIRTD
jgi:hypothetical protein